MSKWQDEHEPEWADDEVKDHLLNEDGDLATEDEWQDMLDEAAAAEPNLHFLAGQRAAFERLLLTAEAYYEGLWYDWAIKPRLLPLIVAPSGHGKNWLVQGLAKKLDLNRSFLRVSPSGWIPLGAKSSLATFEHIHKLIINAKGRNTLLQIDELDKFTNIQQEWSRCCCEEIFAILDRDINHHFIRRWPDQDKSAFKRRLFIVGTGTWQDLWNRSQQKVGFAGHESVDSAFFAAQKEIPQELLFRFCNDLILIPPWTAEDLIEMMSVFGPHLPAEVGELILSKSDEIISSKRGARYIEDLLAIWMVLQKQRALEEPGENTEMT